MYAYYAQILQPTACFVDYAPNYFQSKLEGKIVQII